MMRGARGLLCAARDIGTEAWKWYRVLGGHMEYQKPPIHITVLKRNLRKTISSEPHSFINR